MFCSYCGTQIPDDASFCNKCGKSQKAGGSSDEIKWETCEIAYQQTTNGIVWEAGYFYAEAIGPTGVYEAARTSPLTEYSGPSSDNERVVQAHRGLVTRLTLAGWEPTGDKGKNWWNYRFRRQVNPERQKPRKQYAQPFDLKIDVAKQYLATLETNRGIIVVRLHASQTPYTVNNFVCLAKDGYYDGVKFHRVIKNFMIQGGDPTGTGQGGPGYTFKDEFDPKLKHDKPGVLSMANSGPNTNGSQFFITHTATRWLDGKHTVFGQVIKGQEVVNAIQQGDTILSVKIVE